MNRTELKEASGISFNVLTRLGRNCKLGRNYRSKNTCAGSEDLQEVYRSLQLQ